VERRAGDAAVLDVHDACTGRVGELRRVVVPCLPRREVGVYEYAQLGRLNGLVGSPGTGDGDLGRLRGLDALETGFSLLPMTVVTAAMALLAGRLVPRLGEWPVVVAGLTSGAVAATLVALNESHAHLALLLLSTVPIGFTALAMPAMTGLAMASAPRRRLGLSAGVFNTSRQAGGALGVAVLGTILRSGPGASVSQRPAFLLTAGAYGLAVALAVHHP
jgi:MFS family permease